MDSLKTTLTACMKEYVAFVTDGEMHFMHNDDHTLLSVYFVGQEAGKHIHLPVLLARVLGDHIIIEEDKTNKPLVDALLQAGIERKQIILAYAGERAPETAG